MAKNMEELLPNYTMDFGNHRMLYIWKIFHGSYLCTFIPSRLLQMERKSNHVSFKNVKNCILPWENGLPKFFISILYVQKAGFDKIP
jgi:hypothetical protein